VAVNVDILPATNEHALELAPKLREADVAELMAMGARTALRALTDSMAVSPDCYALLFDGEVAAIFGVFPVSALGGLGLVWLLSGPAVDRHPMAFLRLSRPVLKMLLRRCPRLFNFTDARYVKALAWLEWMGFRIGPPACVFGGNVPFRPIAIGGE
jgi:hypothetical protein